MEKIVIPKNELKFNFTKSSGPGGQNVNKVETGVQLMFDVKNSRSLDDNLKRKIIKLGGKKITKSGVLIIEATRFRTQEKNRIDALERLSSIISEAQKQRKKRKRTSTSNTSIEARIELKKQKSQKKKLRKRINAKNFQ